MEPKITHYLCIGCPLGCRLEVEEMEGEVAEVRGFACKRGKEYALQEHTEPRRMVTTTVQVTDGLWPRLPVKSAAPVLKGEVLPICEALRGITVPAPVGMGQVILPNALGSGIDIIATRDMPGR